MGLPRFYSEALEEGRIVLSEPERRHARSARRLSVGDRVILLDGRGREGEGAIVSTGRDGTAVVIEAVSLHSRPRPELTLAVALPKGERQNVLIEKCTELGTAAIQPITTERSVSSASEHRLDKWRRTTIESAKQSGRCWLPTVAAPRPVSDLAAETSTFDRVIVAVPETEPEGAPSALSGNFSHPQDQPGPTRLPDLIHELAAVDRILAFVGPEGGWTDGELDRLVRAGARRVSLGPNILRIETAAIALAAMVHAVQAPLG